MKRSDELLLNQILDAKWNDRRVSELILEYWRDADRADRTPRDMFYLHIGILSGIVFRLLRRDITH